MKRWILAFLMLTALIVYAELSLSQEVVNTDGIQQIDDLTLYFFTSDKSITVQWDNAIGATDYDFRLWSVERQAFALLAQVPDSGGSSTNISIKVPFTGHFHGYVRSVSKQEMTSIYEDDVNSKTTIDELKELIPMACDIDWENMTFQQIKDQLLVSSKQCSEWTITTDAESCQVTLPDGTTVNKGWWLYGYPAPPTGGGIIN